MAQFRLPGPVCRLLGAFAIDAGTLCLNASPRPGVLDPVPKPGEPTNIPAPEVAHVLLEAETYIGSTEYVNDSGNHECAVFAQQAGDAPHTTKWKPGAHVESGIDIPKGTWVATFVDGKYYGHVGAFDSMDKEGNLTLIDQFNSRGRVDRQTYHVKQQPYSGRISNDPSRYYVVLW